MTIFEIDAKLEAGETVEIPGEYLGALLSEAEKLDGPRAWKIVATHEKVTITKA